MLPPLHPTSTLLPNADYSHLRLLILPAKSCFYRYRYYTDPEKRELTLRSSWPACTREKMLPEVWLDFLIGLVASYRKETEKEKPT